MMYKTNLITCIILSLLFVGCSPSSENSEGTGTEADSTKEMSTVTAERKILVSNEHVHFYEIGFKVNAVESKHDHHHMIVYACNDGKLKITNNDGSEKTIEAKEGDVMYMDAVKGHVAENIGSSDVRFLVLELLKNTSMGNAVDTNLVNSDNIEILLENEFVRVLKGTLALNMKTPTHNHPHRIAYPLTDGKLKFTSVDGEEKEIDIKEGKAMYAPAIEDHSAENIGDTEMKMLVFELK